MTGAVSLCIEGHSQYGGSVLEIGQEPMTRISAPKSVRRSKGTVEADGGQISIKCVHLYCPVLACTASICDLRIHSAAHAMSVPPFTCRTCPVIHLALSSQKKATAYAISSVSPIRDAAGVIASMGSRLSRVSPVRALNASVFVAPGATALTVHEYSRPSSLEEWIMSVLNR